MPRIKLTQLAAERQRPAKKEITYWDEGCPGFGLRVSPKGRKTWIAIYRVGRGSNAKSVMETIGTMATIPSVGAARKRAQASMTKARDGINPVGERRAAETAEKAEAQARSFTFAKLVDRYMAEYAYLNTRPSTSQETRRLLGRAAVRFGDRPITEIDKLDIIELISPRKPQRMRTGGFLEVNNLLGAVRRCFRWAVAAGLIDHDPTVGVLKPLAKEPTRDRVLSDDEIIALWQGCDRIIGWPYGQVFKLLLLTAQRKSEVAKMRWSELDLDNRIWHLPGSRTKNGRPHDVHLSDFAFEIINDLPRFEGRDFVFSTTGTMPVNNPDYAKGRLDKPRDWRLHDLRRTATTGLARLGIAPHVADKILNHTSGTIRGVAAVYNRFEYLDERKAALEAWGRYLETLTRPGHERENVIALRGSRKEAATLAP